MSNNVTEKEARRIVRFLAKGEARLCAAAVDGQVLLDGGDRGTLGVSMGALDALGMLGQILVVSDSVRLAGEGGQMAYDSSDARREDPMNGRPTMRATAVMRGQGGPEVMTVNLAESPLGLLWQRRNRKGERFLTAEEFRAGERLRADYTRGQIMPRLGVNWSAAGASGRRSGPAGGMAEMTDAALAARRRVERAIEAVGPDLSGVLVDICCFIKGFELVETERGWPARSAKVVLKTALSALARHYEPPRATSQKSLLHWGADDYRPTVG